MAVNLKRLVYFDSFMDPIANAIIGRRDDIDLVGLDYDAAETDNWTEIAQAHGYQVQPRGELRQPWFPEAKLLARCPNLIAVSSTGAGYDMIVRAMREVPSYAHIVAEHHERADGSGYPEGRHASQVAIDSQIVAIADAFDAITSKRSYKEASSPFDALRTMRFAMAGQFHDELLRAFIQLLGGWHGIRAGEGLKPGEQRALERSA